MWIDSHCHVTADEFAHDRSEVLERARSAGVEALLAIGAGWGIAPNERAVELAEREPDVFAAVGCHPHDAEKLDDEGRARIAGWLGRPGVVAVGECGLDYWYEHSPRAVQREVFAEHLAWARERGLPVSIHVRGRDASAYEELLDIWRSEGRGDLEGVLHCYTHDLAFARRALDERLWVSFSGILTFRNADALRDVARALPADRILVETDAPLLAPQGRRGRRNEPAWVPLVGQVLADVRGEAPEALAEATARNTRRVFRLPEPA